MNRRTQAGIALLILLAVLGAAALAAAQMNVFLRDGRVITVPVSRDDIIGISFEATHGLPATPAPVAAAPPPLTGLPVQEGLVLWLDATDRESLFQTTRGVEGVTAEKQPIGLWRDKSGNENHFIQQRPEGRPRFGTSAMGGRPAVVFEPAWSLSLDTNFPVPVTVIYVARQTEGQNRRVLQGVRNNWLLGYWNGAKNQAHLNTWVTPSGTPLTDHDTHIFTAIIPGQGQNTEIWVDGLRVASNNAAAIQGPNGLTVNGGIHGGESSHCQIGEIIVYNRALTRPERERIEGYLRKKWLRS